MKYPTNRILNIDIINTTLSEIIPELNEGTIYTANVDHCVLLQKDEEFYRAYKSANYIFLDSRVLLLLSKIIGRPFRTNISGSDLFPEYCHYHKDNTKIKIFLLGGVNNIAQKARDIINKKYNREIIAGAYSPSMGFEKNDAECEEIIRNIQQSGANVLAVGVGAPKQEKWVYQYKQFLPSVHLFMCIGATIDFIAGKQKRAPVILQRLGLEWAFRLFHHPIRLFARYFIRDMQIFYYIFRDITGYYINPFNNSK